MTVKARIPFARRATVGLTSIAIAICGLGLAFGLFLFSLVIGLFGWMAALISLVAAHVLVGKRLGKLDSLLAMFPVLLSILTLVFEIKTGFRGRYLQVPIFIWTGSVLVAALVSQAKRKNQAYIAIIVCNIVGLIALNAFLAPPPLSPAQRAIEKDYEEATGISGRFSSGVVAVELPEWKVVELRLGTEAARHDDEHRGGAPSFFQRYRNTADDRSFVLQQYSMPYDYSPPKVCAKELGVHLVAAPCPDHFYAFYGRFLVNRDLIPPDIRDQVLKSLDVVLPAELITRRNHPNG